MEHRTWKDANLWGRKKRPTEDKIMNNWHRDNAECTQVLAIAGHKLTIPQQSDARKHRMADGFRLPMAFVTTTVIPACLEASCLHA
jgi:hypothetical protein